MVTSWHELPSPSSVDIERFISWFLSDKVHTIRDSMLKSVREECGLGFPPAAFTTNASESLNAMLKEYKKNELPLFIEKVKELVNEQSWEVERALIGRGKYRISEQYQFLAVPESQWFLMTPTERNIYPSFTQQLLRILKIDSIILIHWIVLIFPQIYLVPFHMMSPVLQRHWTYPSPV